MSLLRRELKVTRQNNNPKPFVLTYFDDAEKDLGPDMLINVEWEEIKRTITKEVVAYTERYM